jgi:hypothetical protein
MRRFTVASVVAIGLILVGAISVRIAQAYGASLAGTGVELPSLAIWGIWLTDMMVDFWWFLIPLVFIVSFGIAMMFGSASQTQKK